MIGGDFDLPDDDLDAAPAARPDVNKTRFPCISCASTGTYRRGTFSGECFSCKGRGWHNVDARGQQTRKNAARKGKVTREENRSNRLADWIAQHKAEYDWLLRKQERFRVAAEMLGTLNAYGDLHEGKLAVIRRFMAKDAEHDAKRATVRQERDAAAAATDVSRIVSLFATARQNGLKRPTLRVGELALSLASETSANAGWVYVKRGDTYLGKISPQGTYKRSYESKDEDVALLAATAANPLEQAVAYGRKTGSCACCGRELTNAESIRLGIGPICRDKWGM